METQVPTELLAESFGESATVLSIETAFPKISLALWSAGELLFPKTDLATKRAASLHEGLRELLDSAGLEAKDLEHILIDQGPGSYTGLRVGLALAQTMEFTVSSKVHALYSTDILAGKAAEHAEPGESFAVALDARRGHWSFGVYRREASGLERVEEPRCLPVSELGAVFGPLAFVASPQGDVPGASASVGIPIPEAQDLFWALRLTRVVSQIQPIYLMPPV